MEQSVKASTRFICAAREETLGQRQTDDGSVER
jgi:hypothetical protein